MHEHKRLGRGIEPAALAEQLRAAVIGLEFLTGELQGSHAPDGVVFTALVALSGIEREYIRDRTLARHESARARGKASTPPGVAAGDSDPAVRVPVLLDGERVAAGTRPGEFYSPDGSVCRVGGVSDPNALPRPDST